MRLNPAPKPGVATQVNKTKMANHRRLVQGAPERTAGQAVVSAPPQVREALIDIGLRYVSDAAPGLRRRRNGKGFIYCDDKGRTIRDPSLLRRIRSMVIPPAWEHVWICPLPDGHIQVTGRDARGRKQYRYHSRWNELRKHHKFGRMIDFARSLPRIRAATERDLRDKHMSRRKVLAGVVRIMENTLIRTGCEEYARDNESYGLATIRRRHVELTGPKAKLDFRGKSGQDHVVQIDDPRLVKIIRQCHELPGHELFKYVDENGEVQDVGSGDINDYIREIAGSEFTAKDFRTWGGTVWAAIELKRLGYGRTKAQQKKNLVEAVRRTAARLRNRPATCRNYYIHPAVLQAFEDRTLIERLREPSDNNRANRIQRGLDEHEAAVLRLLEHSPKENGALVSKLRDSIRRSRRH
jgi:DNA topoisomerase-1